MATIAKLATKLTVNSEAFDRKIQKSGTRIKTFGRSAATSRSKLKALGAAMRGPAVAGAAVLTAGVVAATLAVRKFVSVMDDTFKAIDKVAKVSTRLDVPVQELQAFGLGAELAGTSTEVLAKGLTKLARAVGDIKLGVAEKTITDAFEAIGLFVEDIEQLSTSQALRSIADGIGRTADQTKRAAIAMAIFGRSGVELLPFLQQGADGLRNMEVEARGLGFVFDRLDAAGIEAANDSISRLAFQWEGFKSAVATTLALPVETFFTGISDKISQIDFGHFKNSVADAVQVSGRLVGGLITGIETSLSGSKFLFKFLSVIDRIGQFTPSGFVGSTLLKGAAAGEQLGGGASSQGLRSIVNAATSMLRTGPSDLVTMPAMSQHMREQLEGISISDAERVQLEEDRKQTEKLEAIKKQWEAGEVQRRVDEADRRDEAYQLLQAFREGKRDTYVMN